MSAPRPLSLYLHWPFCGSKCPYCDFNSHVRPAIDETRWLAALLRSLSYWHEREPDRRIATVFWGGGTPVPALPPPPWSGRSRTSRAFGR